MRSFLTRHFATLRPYDLRLSAKVAIVAALFGLFLWGDYRLSRRLFEAVAQIEAMSPFFALGILENIFGLVFFVAMLVLFFSAITASISAFFTDLDLELWHALPISTMRIACARLMKALIRSSYLVTSFLLPVFAAFAIQQKLGPAFMVMSSLRLALFLSIPVALAAAVVILLVRYFPVGRVQQIAASLAVLVMTLVIVAFRVARPERLFTTMESHDLAALLEAVQLPAVKRLPAGWLAAATVGTSAHPTLYLTLAAGAALITFLVSSRGYFAAFVRARESLAPSVVGSAALTRFVDRLTSGASFPLRSMIRKEIRILSRDVGQWSQLFMMAALLFVYLYNLQTLPLEGDARAVIVTYANAAMAGFVIAALSLRFAYPAVSAEGRAFWLVASSPLPVRTLLGVKVAIYAIPLVVLSTLLVALGNILLHASPTVWMTTLAASIVMTGTLVCLGVGMGAISPDFKSESPLEVGLSLGGFAYMAVSLLYVGLTMFLLARPIRRFLLLMILGFDEDLSVARRLLPVATAIGLSVLLSVVPLWLARRRLERETV